MLKNNKGISLITTAMTILVLVIILTTLIYTATTNLKVRKLNKLYTDIRSLSDEVSIYYLENKQLPISSEYATIRVGDSLADNISFVTKEGYFDGQDALINPNDFDNSGEVGQAVYYELDKEVLKNITLANKGKYIINVQSHTIYYVDGIEVDGDIYHTINLNYRNVNYDVNVPIAEITPSRVYLPMGGVMLNLKDYLRITSSDGMITMPKSLNYTVRTPSYERYFELQDGKIISKYDSSTATPFMIDVEAISYGTTEIFRTTLTVYLTEVNVWNENVTSNVSTVNLLKGNETILYVQKDNNSGSLGLKAKTDSGRDVMTASIDEAAARSINGVVVYPLTIQANNNGKVILTVLESNGKASKEIVVNVFNPSIAFSTEEYKNQLSEYGKIYILANGREEVAVRMDDTYDAEKDNVVVTWSSSNSDVVQVSSNSEFSANLIAVGATHNEAIVTCQVKVNDVLIETFEIPVSIGPTGEV